MPLFLSPPPHPSITTPTPVTSILHHHPMQDQAALKQPIEGVGVAVGVEGSTTISFRLVIQTSQCGSLIGKGGSKIKEIREVGVGVEPTHSGQI